MKKQRFIKGAYLKEYKRVEKIRMNLIKSLQKGVHWKNLFTPNIKNRYR